MQWEGQSGLLTVCPKRLFQLIFTIRAIEYQKIKWYPDSRESGCVCVYPIVSFQATGFLALQEAWTVCLAASLSGLASGSK